jgi:membrane-associated phospholipid phosphatase
VLFPLSNMNEKCGMRFLKKLRGFDALFLAYLFSVSSLLVLYREGIPRWNDLITQNLILFLFWALVVNVGETRRKGMAWFLRNWYLCAGLPLVFTELQFLIHRVRPQDMDPVLAQLDYRIFGCYPTVWMERFMHPWLTAFLQVCYMGYFPLVLPIGAYLYARNREGFDHVATAIAMMFFLTFLGYLLVPAIGPRFELAAMQTVPLEGVGFTDAMIRWVNQAEGVCRDCFPSGHVSMGTLLIVFSYLTCRFLFPFYAVAGAGILVGTVYLRYHYVVDIPAGIVLGLFCLKAGPWFYRAWDAFVAREPCQKIVAGPLPDPVDLSPGS